MSYLYETIKPTRIYHKQCPHCGLNYLGKTTAQNIEEYTGSGVDWIKHLKEHNVDPIHVWNSDWFYDRSIVQYALDLSEKLNIAESDDWANLKPENGLDGGDTSFYIDYDEKVKNTDYAEVGKSVSETLNSLDWKLRNYKTCPHCGVWCSPMNYSRIHSNRCKLALTEEDYQKSLGYKTCERCQWYGPPGAYKTYHGINCKDLIIIDEVEFNSVESAAKSFNVSKTTIRNWFKSGKAIHTTVN